MVKIIAKYVKELIVNKASGLQTTTLIKLNFLIDIFQGFCPKVEKSYFIEHLGVAACENFKKRKNTQTHLKNESKG